MLFRIKHIIQIFKRETGLIKSDKNLIVVLLLAPIFYGIFYSTVYWHKVETDVPIAVIDMDNTKNTDEIIRNLDAHQTLKVHRSLQSYETGKQAIKSGDIQAFIYFPKEFTSKLKLGKGASVKLFLNNNRFLVSNDINRAVNEVFATMGVKMRLEYFKSQGYSRSQARKLVEPIRTDIRPLFNFIESYGDFLIPGLLVLILQQTLLIGLSESVAKEREEKMLTELFRASGFSKTSLINGKGLFYLLLFGSYALFFFTAIFQLLKINLTGSISALAVLTILLLMSVIYFSIFLSSFLKKKIVALQLFAFTSYPIFLISGYSFPIESMPLGIRWIANLIPSTPYLTAFTRITQMGAGWHQILPELIHISLLLIFFFTLSLLRFKFLFHNQKTIDANIKTQ